MPSAQHGVQDRPPRLVASDLDGTLLHSNGTVTERTSRVWTALPGAGIETVIVTARPPRWLHALEHVVGPRGMVLCANGAFVYEVATRRVLASHTFDPGTLGGVVADLRAAFPGIAFGVERFDGPYFEFGWPDPKGRIPGRGPGPVPVQDVGKLLALDPDVPTEVFLPRVAEIVGERGHLAYSGAFGLAEINPVGVTKAAALESWCGDLGIAASEVWAFGDMPNDLPMLRWAGTGYAVANAAPEVIAESDRVCPSNDEDGVAATLEPLLAR